MDKEELFAMAQAMDTEEYCMLESDTSRVVVVPDRYKNFGVEEDTNVERVKFKFPKIVGDNVDLTTLDLRINFQNASGGLDKYVVDDVAEADDGYITFSWVIQDGVTPKSGPIYFVVQAVKVTSNGNIEKKWSTTLNKIGQVLEGLEVDETIEQQNPDIIESILTRLDELEENGGGTVDPEQIKQAVNGYLEENPVSGMTAEQEQQLNQNTTDVADLKSALEQKINKSGWTPDKYLGTDSDGNVIAKNAPDDSGGSTEISSQNLIDPSQYTDSGYDGDLFTQFGGSINVFTKEIDTRETKTFYYRVYRNNQVYNHVIGLKVGCYDSSDEWLYTMYDSGGNYTENFESYGRENGNNSEPLEIVDDQKVIVKIIGILTIPSEVSKIKIGIAGNSAMINVFYPAFAVSDKPITNFGSITNGDYSLIQGEASGGDEEASSNKPLLNKVLGMIGDSLTNWGGGNDTQNGFLKIIHDRTGILTVNLGLAGATWEEAEGQTQPGVTRVDSYVSGAARYDCIAFLLGTNVANQGDMTDTSATKTTMCGAIKYCLEQLITLSPTTPIIVFLPPQRAEGNTEQKARNDIIKQICEIYGVYTFDLYTRSQVIPNTIVAENGTLSDGLHLSEKGQQNFGRIMSTAILDVMGY